MHIITTISPQGHFHLTDELMKPILFVTCPSLNTTAIRIIQVTSEERHPFDLDGCCFCQTEAVDL